MHQERVVELAWQCARENSGQGKNHEKNHQVGMYMGHTNLVYLYLWATHPVRVCSYLHPTSASLFSYIYVWGLVYMISHPYIFIHVFSVVRLLVVVFLLFSCRPFTHYHVYDIILFHILYNRMEGRRNMKVRHCRRMIRTKKTRLGWKRNKIKFRMLCLFCSSILIRFRLHVL